MLSEQAADLKRAETLLAKLDPNIMHSLLHQSAYYAVMRHNWTPEMFAEVGYLLNLIARCESPIEQQMALALNYTQFLRDQEDAVGCAVTPQVDVVCEDATYRVDFMVSGASLSGSPIRLAVECDGHNFHEKTKAQAAHDKSRDRTITTTGITVIHFTGSEIWRDVMRCANEVWRLFDVTRNNTTT